MDTRSSRHKSKKHLNVKNDINWKYLIYTLPFPITLLVLTLLLNTNTTLIIEALLILITIIIFLIFIILFFFKKRKFDFQISIISAISFLMIFASTFSFGPTNIYDNSDLAINAFQKHQLKEASDKLKYAKNASNTDSYSKEKKAKADIKSIASEILNHTDDKKIRNSIKTSTRSALKSIDNGSDVVSDASFLILGVNYSYIVLMQHYSTKEIREDKGKFIGGFIKESHISMND
ncbi:O-antigen ligase family protein [Companilactobacillus keshanensis]|uniref:O-antigen ligase family protein n=1 Tax=Companilactobacillus keshanensis TaxID=2486003 RepID=A0ABW4BVH0_9LACO|nr:O-antigen ligase family protein [Companilactobacillus keshanensis]